MSNSVSPRLASEKLPEVWLRGPVDGYIPLIQPVVHALLQARDEVNTALSGFDETRLWERPAGVASVAFHLQHLSGVLDRLFTYATGKSLSETQLQDLASENLPYIEDMNTNKLLERFNNQVDAALLFLGDATPELLAESRGVGRQQLPSTVMGLLFHGAEHTMRHLGQLLVTIKVVSQV